METLSSFLLTAFLVVTFSCESSLEPQIQQLHSTARQTGDQVAPMLEALTQRANSINVQGRTLSAEEQAFTSQVASYQETFANWNKDMEKAEAMPANRERLALEQSLLDAINGFRKQVESLAGL